MPAIQLKNSGEQMRRTIPVVDLYSQYLSLKTEIDGAISEVIQNSSFIRGPHVENFETQFAKLVDRKFCLSCANGTDSLFIAMKALGVKPGDEVIAPAHTWISTTETITQAGATVVFCDTTEDTFTIEPEEINRKITDKTVGIIPVHLFGQAADMEPIMEIAAKKRLWVIEDCAQAHLARYKGRQVGTFGVAASYSFYPGKNLGAMGDAGAIVTNDKSLDIAMRKYARHGGLIKNQHEVEGINSRMDGMQAAILNVKIPQLKKWTEKRRKIASKYDEGLGGTPNIQTPPKQEGKEHVYHLYVIKTERRDELAKHLKSKGIETIINYPKALPFVQAYSRLGHTIEDFPNAAKNQDLILSLPMYPELTQEDIERVIFEIRSFLGNNGN